MIDTKSLKISLIDLAMSGNLSIHFDAKDSVSDIVKAIPEISNKRKKLLKQSYEYGPRFEIPENWQWVKLGEISSYGDTPIKTTSINLDDDTWILDLEDIKTGGDLLVKKRAHERQFIGEKTVFKSGQILYSKLRPYLKKILIADENGISTPELISFDVFGGILPKYIMYWLQGSYTSRAIDKRSYGIKMPRIDAGFMVNLPVPIPPVSEQRYIIEKIDTALSLINTIDNLQNEYETNKEVLKKKVFDACVQGKLTERLPKNGDAYELYRLIKEEKTRLQKEKKIKKEKALPDISETDAPFEIPQNWKWVYMGDIFQHNTGKALNASDTEGTLLEYITTSNLYWDKFELDCIKKMYFSEDEIGKCTITKGDLLVCEGGDIGRSAIWPYDYDMRIQNHIHRLRGFLPEICARYYYYVLWLYKQNGMIDGRGIGLQGFSSKRLHTLIVPLPPASEQKKIADTIDELLAILSR